MKNQVILNKDENTAKLIREYFESKGVDTSGYKITYKNTYYGVINGIFSNWSSFYVEDHNAEIIELPIKKEYPKVMWVWGDKEENKRKRVVFSEKKGKFLAWHTAETIEEAEKEIHVSTWDFAQDIEEPKQITIQQAEKILNDLGNNVKIV